MKHILIANMFEILQPLGTVHVFVRVSSVSLGCIIEGNATRFDFKI